MDGSGHQLFAGAAFAGNEHVGRGVRDRVDDLVHLLHFLVGADHVFEPGQTLHLLFELTVFRRQEDVFPHQPLSLQRFRHQTADSFRTDGLGEVVVGAFPHGLDRRVDAALPGDDDDFQRQVQLLDLAQKLDAGHAGHHQVDEKQVELAFLQPLKRRAAIVLYHGFVAFHLQHCRQALGNRWFVVCYQNACASGFFHLLLSRSETQGNGGSFSHLAVKLHLPAVELDEPPRDRQPDARALLLGGEIKIEDFLHFLL